MKKILTSLIIVLLLAPNLSLALSLPQSGNDLASQSDIKSKAYVLADAESGELLAYNNQDLMWPPASLTKLVTVLVILEAKPKLTKTIAMTSADQTAGGCSAGGACLSTKAGIKYRLIDLLYATLVSSYNNAAHAASRSLGLTDAQFAEKMNEKAASLGATSTHFNEATGMNPNNYTTAADYIKIVKAAFSNDTILKIAQTQKYSFAATNSSRYKHTVKSTNKLLDVPGFTMIAGKTGYLDESLYNFASLVKDKDGKQMIVVVLGSPTYAGIFADTEVLANLSDQIRFLALLNKPSVLGTSTQLNILP